jgi:GTP pyrophosphokinase
VNLDAVAAKAGFAKSRELYAAAARDEVNTRQIQTAIKAVLQPGASPATPAESKSSRGKARPAGAGGGILVVGVDRLMTNSRAAASPRRPTDRRVRHARQGRDDPSPELQQRSCAHAQPRARAADRAPTGARRATKFSGRRRARSDGSPGLLRDITEIFSRERINVTAANTLTKNSATRMAFTLEVKSLAALGRALAMVRDVRGVLSAGRR